MLFPLLKQWAGFAALTATMLVVPAFADEELSGAEEYRSSCASCHGVSGKGDGPQAESLTIKPADLTMITEKNGGVFPERKILDTIDGRWFVFMHGDRAMPVWGARYSAEMGGDEQAVRSRILKLVHYIQSIQQ
jgi:mono/diheme cytochrome c family protein